jgi:hypothetical protein
MECPVALDGTTTHEHEVLINAANSVIESEDFKKMI